MKKSQSASNCTAWVILSICALSASSFASVVPVHGTRPDSTHVNLTERTVTPTASSPLTVELQAKVTSETNSGKDSDGPERSENAADVNGTEIFSGGIPGSNVTDYEVRENVSIVQSLSQLPQLLKEFTNSSTLNILVVGLAHSVKRPSIIPQILGKEQKSQNDTETAITEYAANISLSELHNLQLRVVDTPYLSGNTSKDARIFATLFNHYSVYTTSLPDLVVIFLPLDAGSDDSSLTYVVKRFAAFKEVFTRSSSNSASKVLYVLTPTGNQTVHRNSSSLHDLCGSTANEIRKTIQAFTGEENPKLFIIDLPSSELNATRGARDLCSQNSIDAPLALPMMTIFDSSIEIHPLVHTNHAGTAFVQRIWDADDKIRGQPPNEVNTALKLTSESNLINPELKNKYPGSLQLLQMFMLIKNVTRRTQVPTVDNRNEIARLLYNATDMNPMMQALLQATFQLAIPEIPFDPVVGKGYDPVTDSPTESPFTFDELEFCALGYMLPTSMRLVLSTGNSEVNHIKFHSNIKSMVAARMKELNLTSSLRLNETAFKGELRTGDNVLSLYRNGATRARLSGLREVREFYITLNRHRLQFKPEFLDQINTMPKLSTHDQESVQEWKALLDEYGSHVVTLAFGGGYLEALLEVKGQEFKTLKAGNVSAVKSALESALSNLEQTQNTNPNMTVLSLTVHGGDDIYQNLNLANVNRSISATTLNSWKDSVRFEPVMLPTKLELVPLSEFVRVVNASAGDELAKATRTSFEGNLKFVPLPLPARPASTPKPPTATPVPAVQGLPINADAGQSSGHGIKLKRAEDSVLPARSSAPAPGPASINPNILRNMLPTREDLEKNNKLLECLQAFIASLDKQMQRSPEDSTLAKLTNDIEHLYNQIANTGTAKAREKLLIEVICLNFSKTQSLPLDQLKNLVQFQEELVPAEGEETQSRTGRQQPDSQFTAGQPSEFPDLQSAAGAAKPKSADLIKRMRSIAGAVWRLDDLPVPQRHITDYRFIGYGYDLLWDHVTPSSPFLLTENSFIKINMRSFELNRPEITFQEWSHKSKYVMERWHALVPNMFQQLNSAQFRGTMQPGHSYMGADSVSVLIEFIKALIRLPLDEPQNLRVKEEFWDEVAHLGSIDLDLNNCTSTNAWKQFFNRHGTHIVTEAFVGGAMEIKVARDQINYQNATSTSDEIKSWFLHQTAISNCTFRVIGGNSSIFSSPTDFTSGQLRVWFESIQNNLAMLPTNIKLKNLYHILLDTDPVMGPQFLRASNAYHAGQLNACAGSIQCAPFLRFNETAAECVCPEGQIRSEQDGKCETMAGQTCSTVSSWDHCVPNAVCKDSVRLDSSMASVLQIQGVNSVCACREGYETLIESGICAVQTDQVEKTSMTITCNSEAEISSDSYNSTSSRSC